MLESRQVNPIPIRNKWNCRTRSSQDQRRVPLLLWSSPVFQLSGGEKQWNAFCYFPTIQAKLTDRKSPHERRFGTPLDGPVIPLGAEMCCNPISTKDKSRLHQCGTKMFPGVFIGYALNSGGGWTEDLTIADLHDIENNAASEVHVNRFKPKEVGIMKLQEAFVFFSADGSLRQEGHAQRYTLRHQ